MRSQRQLPHQIPRPVPRRPLTPCSQGHHVFCSIVFCLHFAHKLICLSDRKLSDRLSVNAAPSGYGPAPYEAAFLSFPSETRITSCDRLDLSRKEGASLLY